MQFWIGLLVGAVIGASVGLLVLSWLHAGRREDDLSERGFVPRTGRGSRWRSSEARVLEMPRSVPLTSIDTDTLRVAAAALEARDGNSDEARRLRDIASRADAPAEARPLRRGS